LNKKIIFLAFGLTSCAGLGLDRSFHFPAAGGIAGGFLGRVLSPNRESTDINTAVFGALGAGLGYLANRIFSSPIHQEEIPSTLKERELRPGGQEFVLPATEEKLPAFVKKRLTPIVIEEYLERDTATEDGGIREPHKVWRIKRQPELVPLKK
jgi:hypothetical protein